MSAPDPSPRARPRQVLWLGSLLVVLAVVVWMQFFRTAGSDAGASKVMAEQTDTGKTVPLPTPQAVRLGDLDAVGTLSEVGRNPFTYGARPAPPAPPVRPVGIPSAPAMSLPVGPPVPQGPPPIALRLTGIAVVQDSGRPMVTLKDPVSNAVFQAFEGDIVDGRYRVVKVGGQSVVLSYLDGSGTRTISLGG